MIKKYHNHKCQRGDFSLLGAVHDCHAARYLHLKIGHRPVIVKRALIGSKGRWILSTIFMLKSVS